MPSALDRIAYGLRVRGLPEHAPLLAHPPGPRWPDLRLAHEPPARTVAATGLTVPLRGGGDLRLEGETATFLTSEPPVPDALVHPLLTAAAAGRNRLLGRDVLHAGAVVLDGLAWALAGSNEVGKSTLLAALAALGLPVLSDDLLVLAGGTAFAGPRCADLRAATRIPGLPPPRPVRGGARWRVLLPAAPASAPLAGFVFLAWDDAPAALRALDGEERMRRLAPLRRWPFLPDRPGGLLDLVTLPAYKLSRPRGSDPAETARVVMGELKARAPSRPPAHAGPQR
jgi:hypothetical protein